MKENKTNHLRLVKSHVATIECHITNEDQKCADFFLDDNVLSLFLISEEDALQSDRFLPYLRDVGAKYLFDVRTAPRLDFISPSRLVAFQKMCDIGVDYVDLIGALEAKGEDSINAASPELWAGIVRVKIQALAEDVSSVAFIFDDVSILRRAEHILPSTILGGCNSKKLRVQALPEMSRELIAM